MTVSISPWETQVRKVACEVIAGAVYGQVQLIELGFNEDGVAALSAILCDKEVCTSRVPVTPRLRLQEFLLLCQNWQHPKYWDCEVPADSARTFFFDVRRGIGSLLPDCLPADFDFEPHGILEAQLTQMRSLLVRGTLCIGLMPTACIVECRCYSDLISTAWSWRPETA